LITLKIALFAPIPTASVRTATAVKPGFAQRAQAVADVVKQSFEEPNAARLAAFLFDALCATELQPRPPHCFPSRHAAAHQILRVRLEVETEFRIHVALQARASQHGR
jgi:hypothetical protein